MSLLVTTPIFYVNSKPHLGHAFSMIIADTHVRWLKQIQLKDLDKSKHYYRIKMSTGTDEHGQKIFQAAQKHGIKVEDWCDNISGKFQELSNKLNIWNPLFIRTTDCAHKDLVKELWIKLIKNGDIYKGTHEGWYSVSDETFYSEDETKIEEGRDGESVRLSIETGQRVEWISEVNYRFRLAKYIPSVREWIEKNDPIAPKSRVNDLRPFLDAIERDQKDLSVSRRKSVAKWGIPVPGDEEDQLIYVWLDALTNYLTAALKGDENLKESRLIHIVGKDILKFHAVYWPAFLKALDLPLPEKIISHGHWTMKGDKMSKSLGNVVDPIEVIDDYFSGNADPLRFHLLRNSKLNSDGPFSFSSLASCYNNELVGNLGNLMSRVFKQFNAAEMALISEMADGNDFGNDYLMIKSKDLPARTDELYSNFQYGSVADSIMEVLSLANRHVSATEPWKFTDSRDRHYFSSEISKCLKIVGKSLEPIMPSTSRSIEMILSGQKALPKGGLFPRLKTTQGSIG